MTTPYAISKESKKLKELLAEEYDETKAAKTVNNITGYDPRVRSMAPLPACPKKPGADEIKNLIKSVPVFKQAFSVVNKREGPSDLLPPPGSLIKNQLQWTYGKQDSAFYTIFQQVGFEQKIPEKEMVRVLAYIDARIWAGGSIVGLYTRLNAGFKNRKTTPLALDKQSNQKWLSRVLPVDKAQLPNLSAAQDIADLDIDVNFKSGAGAPFLAGIRKQHFSKLKTVVSVAKIWYGWAQQIALKARKFEDLAQYVKENEDMFCALIANKYCLMERSDLNKKVRPYYRFPAAPSYLFQAYTQPLQTAVRAFWEDKESSCALRFSWAHGGLRRIQRWMLESRTGFSFLVYGDDLLFILRLPGTPGKVWVSAPDCQFLDMSLVPEWAQVYAVWVKEGYSEKFSELWHNLLSLHMKEAWKAKVVLEAALTVLKDSGLNSGIVGTTLIDCVAAATAAKRFKDSEAKALGCKDAKSIEGWANQVWADVREDLGLVLKDGTGGWVEWRPDKPLPVKFLGYVGKEITMLVEGKKKTFWLPYKPAEEWAASLSYVATDERDGVRDGTPPLVIRLSSLFGVYFSGGYVHRWVAEAIKRLYSSLRDTPGAGFKPKSSGLDTDLFDFDYLANKLPWLPERNVLARFFDSEEVVPLSDVVRGYTPARKEKLTKAEIEDLKDEASKDDTLEDLSVLIAASGVVKQKKLSSFANPPLASDKHFGVKGPDLAKQKQRDERKKMHQSQLAPVEQEERDRDKRRGVPDPEDFETESVANRSDDLKWEEEQRDADDTMEDYREKERTKAHDEVVRPAASEAELENPPDDEPAYYD